MENRIHLVDHTINAILNSRQDAFIDHDIFEILSKYSVMTIDLSLQSMLRLLHPLKSFEIRMEVDFGQLPLQEFYKYYYLDFDAVIIRWRHGEDTKLLAQIFEQIRTVQKKAYLKIVNSHVLKQTDFEDYELLMRPYAPEGFIISDTESGFDPYRLVDCITQAKESLTCKLEFCAGNGCGLASANSLSAIRCGIGAVHTVVGGANLTEGAAMEEVILACKYFQMAEICGYTGNLAGDCRKVLKGMQLKIPADKAIIGNGIFSHESGIHVDGIIKNPRLYEVISPEDVGVKRKIVIGKHSGKAAIRMRYLQMGLQFTEEELELLTHKIRQLSLIQNSSLSYKQLIDIYLLHRRQGQEADSDEKLKAL